MEPLVTKKTLEEIPQTNRMLSVTTNPFSANETLEEITQTNTMLPVTVGPVGLKKMRKTSQQNPRSMHHSGIRFAMHRLPLLINRIHLTSPNRTLLLSELKGTILTSHILLTQRGLLGQPAAKVVNPGKPPEVNYPNEYR